MTELYKNNELISIILPVYNGEKYLAKSIQSCLDQTYENIELIVVNDFSTDKSLEIVKEFILVDKRIKVISNTQNKKLPASLNIGHSIAQGEYITWTSDDNIFKPMALERLYSGIVLSGSDIIYSNYEIIDSSGSTVKDVKLEDRGSLLLGNTIGASFLYKREVFIRNNGYQEVLHTVEDYDFWLRAMFHSNFYFVPENLYQYRIHNQSLSSNLNFESSTAKKSFESKLKLVYGNLFKSIDMLLVEEFINIIIDLNLYKKINVHPLLSNYTILNKNLYLLKIKLKHFDIERFKNDLDIRIRSNIIYNDANKNFKTLYLLIRYRPSLLFKYDKRNSLKIIKQCIMK